MVNDENQDYLKGGIKLNFDFIKKKILLNEISVNKHILRIHTEFEFSKKAKLVLPLCNHENTTKVLKTIIEKFKIVDGESISIYERELSLTLHEIFYRKLEPNESPLNLFILWKLNQERKSLVIMDHDPNARKYEKYSIEELQERLENVNCEENELIKSIQENYQSAKFLIAQKMAEIKS